MTRLAPTVLLALIVTLIAPPAYGQPSPLNRSGAGLTPVASGSAAAADIDGDGDQDLVITGQQNAIFGNQIATLYKNDGSGDFTEVDAGLSGVFGGASAFADVDGDGDQDLLIAGESGASPTATLYENDGSGNFTEADAGLNGVQNPAVAFGDIDGDDDPDLVITGVGGGSFEANTTTYENDGSGNFTETDAGLADVENGALDFGDIDGDGDQDLILTGSDADFNDQTILYENDGGGNFAQVDAGLTTVGPGSVELSDIDGDGAPDLIVTGFAESGRSAILYTNDGSGSFSEAGAGLDPIVGAAALGDVNGDGAPDLVLTGNDGSGNPAAKLYENDGGGGFSSRTANLTGGASGSAFFTDADGDDDQDLLVTGGGALFDAATRLYVNNTTQTGPNRPPRATRFPGSDTTAAGLVFSRTVEIGDPDGDPVSLTLTQDESDDGASFADRGDGTAPFEYVPSRSAAGSEVPFTIEASDGQGESTSFSFSVRVPDAFEANRDLAPLAFSSSDFGDIDGDGDQDLVVTGRDTGGTQRAILYESDGDGGFSSLDAGLTAVESGASEFADIDGDGDLDLLIAGDTRPGELATIYENDGSGNFSSIDAGLSDVSGAAAEFGDVDGDGDPDLVLIGTDGNGDPQATLYENDGSGSFASSGEDLANAEDASVDLADTDGDGDLDLLITGEVDFSASTILYENDGSGSFSQVDAGLDDAQRSDAAFGDIDGDGDQDLILAGTVNFSPGTVVYENDGSGSFTARSAPLRAVSRASVELGDIDADGDLDLVLAGENNDGAATTQVYRNDGTGAFSRAGAGLSVGAISGAVELGDANGDGNLDAVVTGTTVEVGGDGQTIHYENLRESTITAEATRTVDADGAVDFGNTGVSAQFSGTSGSGTVAAKKIDAPPSGTAGVDESTASRYRFEISAGGNLAFSDSTELRLDVSTLGGVGDASNVTVYKRSPRNSGPFRRLPTSFDAAGDKLVATTGSLSEFVLASNSEPLPVELAGFEGTTTEEGVRLAWQTASETNNAGFEVQRKAAGKPETTWTKIGFVESTADGGTTDKAQSYRFTDENIPFQTDELRYRLRQVDLGGTESLTEPVSVERKVAEMTLRKTFPNPARGQATVQFAVPESQDVTLRMYDVLGRTVRTVHRGKTDGRQELRLDLSGLASGAYFLRLEAGQQTQTQKLTIIR